MQRTAVLVLILLTATVGGLMTVCGSDSSLASLNLTSIPAPDRNVEIEVLTAPTPEELFEIGHVFDLRDREGFLIWTQQAYFWQPGDLFRASSLEVEVVFDDATTYDPFVFWRSSALNTVYNEDGDLIGTYLAGEMNINVDTSLLSFGHHTVTVNITTPHDEVFTQTWEFVIHERETPRSPVPPELAPTADYLNQHPMPTPVYVLKVSAQAEQLDRFSPIGWGEAVCLTIDDDSFVPSAQAGDLSRPSMWDEIHIAVDGTLLRDDQIGIQDTDSPGVLFVCFDTDYLAAGIHLAALNVTVNGIDSVFTYTWAFVIGEQ